MNREVFAFWGGWLLGGSAGIALGVGAAAILYGGEVQEARVFPQNNQPSIMRIYNSGTDHILVEKGKSSDGKSTYIPLEIYLNQFEPFSNRVKEEKRIKIIVGWDQELKLK